MPGERRGGRGGRGGTGGSGGAGGSGGDPGGPGVAATAGEPGQPGQPGLQGERGERGPQGPRGRSFMHNGRLRMIAFLTLAVAATVSGYLGFHANLKTNEAAKQAKQLAVENKRLLHQFLVQRTMARDQSCRADEREHKANVDSLKQTYRLLSDPSERALVDPGLVRLAVLIFLPEQERKARKDQAPPYCDEPGVKAERLWFRTHGKEGKPPVGLREPDPVVPKRRDFSFLLGMASSLP